MPSDLRRVYWQAFPSSDQEGHAESQSKTWVYNFPGTFKDGNFWWADFSSGNLKESSGVDPRLEPPP
jgi:hypothetical protein